MVAMSIFPCSTTTIIYVVVDQDKLMELLDKERDVNMVDAGVCVVDDGNTSVWRLDDIEVLQKERDEKRQKALEETIRALRQKRLQKVEEISSLVPFVFLISCLSWTATRLFVIWLKVCITCLL